MSPVSSALADLVARGVLTTDGAQAEAARVLDRIAADLDRGPSPLRGRPRVRGAYLVGAVGRGKTLLMDLFFAAAPTRYKRRTHFDEFMDEMHGAITAYRLEHKGDPVAAVVKPLLREVKLLCLDEFQVSDITNAMLLGRLFEKLFAGGVTLVATSNTLPDELYRNGLNRELVLPFIARLKSEVEVVHLDGHTDYRRLKLSDAEIFAFGDGPKTAPSMDRVWSRLTGGVAGQAETLRSLGRDIAVPAAAMGAARFSFAALCEAPLGARDYLRLAHRYDALMIDDVPVFGRDNANAAKRFNLLIDTLYDRRVMLAASFAVPLDRLVGDSPVAAELQRTVSRLSEMQSKTWLEASRSRSGATKG
ncbi:MAG: cell division protein ZapE [Devosia sp.]